MKYILFIIYPAYSHVIAVSKFASELKTKGYHIIFVGMFDEKTKWFLKRHNFGYYSENSVPFGLAYTEALGLYKSVGLSRANLIADVFNDNDFTTRKEYFELIFKKTPPEIVFLDSFISSDFLCLYNLLKKSKISFFFLNQIAIFQSHRSPPSNSFLLPSQSTLISIFWYFDILKRKAIDLIRSMLSFGRISERRLWDKIYKMGLNKYEPIDNHPFNISFLDIPEVVLSHKEWDFSNTNIYHSQRFYIGFLANTSWNTDISFENNRTEFLNVLQSPKKIIYISFGTTNSKNEIHFLKFIKKIIKISESLYEYNIIIGAVPLEVKRKLNNSKNVYIFGILNQNIVLSKSSLFISHGGFNSIKESIYFKVPMLIVPINLNFDQPGNSSRVIYHKIGLRSSVSDSPKQILLKINLLFKLKEMEIKLEEFNELERSKDISKTIDSLILNRHYID